MSHRLLAPHEEELEAMIRRLEPAAFQKFVENYAQIRWPNRFGSLIPIGRNTTSTTKNWPDAIALAPNGKVHALEVTHAQNWDAHLGEDVDKISTHRHKIASFIFIAWATPKATDDPSTWHQKIVDLGVDTEFIFGKQFVRDLKDPRYAPLWSDLGLAISCDPLELIGRSDLFGGDDLDTYQPTRAEYVDGLVHRSSVFDDVMRQLGDRHHALIRGEGASGKTVLATQIAFASRYYDGDDKPHIVYYVDLGVAAEHLQLHQAFVSRAPAARLMIVDNVHLAPGVAAGLFETWRDLRGVSDLLLLGRNVDVTNVTGKRLPLTEVETDAISLRVTADDLLGVYQRIARRIGTVGQPPDDDVHEWLNVFGGDLIAFSLAVSRRAKGFVKGEWTLRAADAHDYITDHYLAHTTGEERETLLRIAVGADGEVITPVDVVDAPPPKHLLEHGIVRRTLADSRTAYSFVHPGFGKLFMAAMPTGDLLAAQRAFTRVPMVAHLLAARLYDRGRIAEAKEIMLEFRDPSRCEALLAVAYASPCRLLVNLGILTVEETEARVRRVLDDFMTRVLARTPHRLLGQIGIFRTCVPALADALIERLAAPGNLEQWLEVALTAAPDQIIGLLKVLQQYLSEADVARADAYISKKNAAISKLVREATLPDLVNFALAKETGFRRFCTATLHGMTKNADLVLKKANDAIAADPLRGLSLVRTLAYRTVGVLHARLDALRQDAAVFKGMLKGAETSTTRFAHALRVMGSVAESHEITAAVARLDREAVRKAARSSGLRNFTCLLALLEKHHCIDLARVLADDEVREPVASRWVVRGPITQISQVLRLATGATDQERGRFLDKTLVDAEIYEFQGSVQNNILAVAMFNVWLDRSIPRGRLHLDALAVEIERRLQHLPPVEEWRFADATRFLAILVLFDLPRPLYDPPASRSLLNDMCREFALPVRRQLQGQQLLIWLGVRHLDLPIAPTIAAEALQFDTPEPRRPPLLAIQTDVRNWLESM